MGVRYALWIVVAAAAGAVVWLLLDDYGGGHAGNRSQGEQASLPADVAPVALRGHPAPRPGSTGVQATGEGEGPSVPAFAFGAPSGAIEGTVVDVDGLPLEGIRVHLDGLSEPRNMVTDVQGRFRFLGVPAHYSPWVWAAPGGRVPRGPKFGARVHIESGRTHEVVITLVEGLTTRGRVVRHDGAPVSGATVWVVVSSMWTVPTTYLAALTTESGSDGAFTLAGIPKSVPPSSVEIHAVAPGLPEGHASLGATLVEFDEEPRRPEDPITVVLGEPCFVRVQVVDEATGEGVPNARLGRGRNVVDELGRTDDDGWCRVGPIPPGRMGFHVRGTGWSAPYGREAVFIEAFPGAEPEYRHEMHRVFDLRGRIVYADGKPADDRAFGVVARREGMQVSTTCGQEFHFLGVSSGTWEVVVSSRGMEGADPDATDGSVLGRAFVETGTDDAVVVLYGKRPLDLEIVVEDGAGEALADGRVLVRSVDEEWNMHNVWGPRVLNAGRAVVTGVVHPLWVEVEPPPGSGWARRRVGPVKPGTPSVTIRLEPGHTIAGRVVDEQGSTVEGAHVRLFPDVDDAEHELFGWSHDHGDLWTNEDGAFEFDRLWAGAYWIWVEPPEGYATGDSTKVASGSRDVVVQARRRVGFAVPVLDAAGLPLAGAWVGVWSPPYFSDDSAIAAVTDDEGVAHLVGVDPEGNYCLEVKPPAGLRYSRRLWIEPWAPSTLPVRLPSANGVEGLVLDAQGQPIVGATVRLHRSDGSPASVSKTTAGGRFLFLQLTPEAVTLIAVSPDGRASSPRVEVAPPATDVELLVREGEGRLLVQIAEWPPTNESALPWRRKSSSYVVWDPAAPQDRRTGTPTPDGRLDVDGLDPTIRWSLLVRHSDRPLALRLDGLLADGTQRRVPARAPLTIEGRVTSPEAVWPHRVEVVETGNTYSIQDYERFRIDDLPPGRWTLRASAYKGRTQIYRTVVATGAKAPLIDFGPR